MSFPLLLALLSSLASPIVAQTWTSCNPLNKTDCPPDPALGITHNFDFTKSDAGSTWNTTNGDITYGPDGAEFTIKGQGDSPTIQTNFYIFFGEVEVWLKAATGKGVVSSSVLQSDDLDEIDWEFIGNNASYAETNYYGKGNVTDAYLRAKWHPSADATVDFHNYTVRWTKDAIDWYIDGNLTRTLAYADANGGQSFPQTPMNVRLGIWPAGDPKNDKYTVEWAGGEIDYKKGPYTMTIKSCRITDFSSGKEYKYGDKSGTWQSIDVTGGNSTAAETLSAPPSQTVGQRWSGLSKTAKIAIGASIAGAFVGAILLFFLYCVKQRRAGRKERALEDSTFDKDTAELLQYRAEADSKSWDRH